MPRLALVTDSTSDIPADMLESRQLYSVPLHIIWGKETLRDGVDIQPRAFYERLATDPITPTTSQPTPEEFAAAYQQARDETGADEIITLTISAALSGTYDSAKLAAGQMDFPVHVVDSRTASLALGLLVLGAADLRDSGAAAQDIVSYYREKIPYARAIFSPLTLEYLHKGGRIGGAQRLLGTALNIKPVVHVDEGKVEALGSVRTRKRVIQRFVELATELKDRPRPFSLGIIHGNALEEAEQLRAELEAVAQPDRMVMSQFSPVLGVHVGPGTLGFGIV